MALKTKWELVDFNELIEQVSYTKKIDKKDYLKSGKYPIIDQSETFISGFWDNDEDVFKIKKPVVLFGDHTRIFKYVDFDFVLGADGIKILQPIESVDPKFFYYIVSNIDLPNLGYSRHFKELKRKKIPLPPLPVQQELVTRLDRQHAIIEQCNAMEKAILEAGIDDSIFEGDWEWVELGELIALRNGISISNTLVSNRGKYPVCGSNGIYGYTDNNDKLLFGETIVVGRVGAYCGNVHYYDVPIWVTDNAIVVTVTNKDKLKTKYLYYFLLSKDLGKYANVTGQPYISQSIISSLKVPLPPIEKQQKIVDFLNVQFETLTNIRRLKENAKQTIKMILDREVFGE